MAQVAGMRCRRVLRAPGDSSAHSLTSRCVRPCSSVNSSSVESQKSGLPSRFSLLKPLQANTPKSVPDIHQMQIANCSEAFQVAVGTSMLTQRCHSKH